MKNAKYTSGILLFSVLFLGIHSYLYAQQSFSGNFISGGVNRIYYGAIPDTVQNPLRLVILFCGATENPLEMVQRGFNDHLGKKSLIVYPQAFDRMAGFNGTDSIDDYQMVQDLITHIASNYTIDSNDICIGGFSSGGNFTYKLACDFNSQTSSRPYKFKAIAVVSGYMDTSDVNSINCPISHELPLIVFHGTGDSIAYYNGGSQLTDHMTETTETIVGFWANIINGCNTGPTLTPLPDLVTEQWAPSTVEHLEFDCGGSRNTQFYRIVGGTHAWPGGNAFIDFSQDANKDINASELIAEFFEFQNTISVAEEYFEPESVSVYPNPFKEELSIKTDKSISRIEIVNLIGNLVFSESQPNTSIDLDHLSPGIYMVKIHTGEKSVTKKIIKN